VTATSPRLSRAEFRRACARFATGITVVSTRADDGSPHGLTVNSFTSVSAEPPLVLVCIDRQCSLLCHFQQCEYFAINFLAEDQEAISRRFAESLDARFDGVRWHASPTGSPLLHSTLGALECRVSQRVETGDHVLLIGLVLSAKASPGRPLVYFNSAYQQLKPQE